MGNIVSKKYFKHYQGTRPEGLHVSESDFYFIVKHYNNYLIETLLTKHKIILPKKLGSLSLIKKEYIPTLKDGKVVNLPPLFPKNNNGKIEFVRMDITDAIMVRYRRKGAHIRSGRNVMFRLNRCLKARIKKLYKEGKLDTYYG